MTLPCCVSVNAEREAKFFALFKPWNRPYFTTEPCPNGFKGCCCDSWSRCYVPFEFTVTVRFLEDLPFLRPSQMVKFLESNSDLHFYKRFINGNKANEKDTRIPIRTLLRIAERSAAFVPELYFDSLLNA